MWPSSLFAYYFYSHIHRNVYGLLIYHFRLTGQDHLPHRLPIHPFLPSWDALALLFALSCSMLGCSQVHLEPPLLVGSYLLSHCFHNLL